MKLLRQLLLSQSLFLSELCDQRAGIRLPHNVSPFGFCWVDCIKKPALPQQTLRGVPVFRLIQHPFQVLPRKAGRTGRHLLRGAGDNDGAAAVAPLRAKVDEVVGALDDVQIVLNDHHGVPRVHQPLEDLQQLAHVIGVQAGGRLVQNIDGLTGGLLGKLRSQFHPLGLAAGQLRGGLPQFHIAQAHIL